MTRVLPPILLAAILLLMALLHAVIAQPVLIPESQRWIGGVPVLVGVAIATAARIQFARARTNINTFGEPGRLVTSGVFRLSRNPMYVGLSLVAAGAGLACGTPTSLALAASFVIITDRWYIPFEERRLRSKFGEDYESYRRTTARWIWL